MPKIIRVTTIPISLKLLLTKQMLFLKNNGFDVLMVSSFGQEIENLVKEEECKHLIINMSRSITPLQDIKALWNFIKLFRIEKPDIIHSNTPKSSFLSMIAGKITNVNIRIYTVTGLRFQGDTGLKKDILILAEKLTCFFATHIIAEGCGVKKIMLENNITKKTINIIGQGSINGVDLDRFSTNSLSDLKIKEIKEKINYSDEYKYFLFVGRLVKDKGIQELIISYMYVYKTNPKIKLIIVGGRENSLSPLGDEIDNILSNTSNIIEVGFSSDVEYYMAICDYFVFPSHREGFPNVLLQAGSIGCPIICSNIPANLDIVENIDYGLIFNTKNHISLAEALNFALLNPDEMKKRSNKLQKKIIKNYDVKLVHENIYKEYISILESSKKFNTGRL